MSFVPSLFIGAGGVGKNILLRIRRLIVERYGSLDDVPSIRFLHVDTDAGKGPDGQSTISLQVLGESIAFTGSERIELAEEVSRQIQTGVHAIKQNPAIREWFADELPLDNTFKDGAGGVRYYGRLAFHFSVQHFRRAVHEALLKCANLNDKNETARALGVPPDTGVNVYIACSLLGGTGSGTFLEIAYNVREVIASTGLHAKTYGLFVIGGAPESVSKANCYAALKELDYYSTSALHGRDSFAVGYPIPDVSPIQRQEPPVDYCYLVDAVNERGEPFNRNQLEECVATNLFLEFASGIADHKRGKRVDMMEKTPGYNVKDGLLGRSQRYFTFGLGVLEFPAPRVQELLADRLAQRVMAEWRFEKAAVNLNPVGAVRDFLREHRLEEKELIGDLQSAGAQSLSTTIEANLQSQERDLNTHIEGVGFDRHAIVAAAQGNIDLDLHLLHSSPDPKQRGTIASTVVTNMEQKLRDCSAALRQRIADYVGNEHLGPGAAEKFLDALLSDLTGKVDAFARRFNALETSAAQAQEAVFHQLAVFDRHCYPNYIEEARYHNKQLHRGRLKGALEKALGRESYRAACALLRQDYTENGEPVLCLLSEVKLLQAQLGKYRETLVRMGSEFAEDAQRLEETLVSTTVSDSLSVTTTRLTQLEQDLIPNPLQHVQTVRLAVETDLGEKNSVGDLVRPRSVFDAILRSEEEARRAIIHACTRICARARRISVAAELARLPDRKAVIAQRIRQSAVLLQLTGIDATVGHSPENSYRQWLATSNPETDADLSRVTDEIKAVQSFPLHVSTLSEPFQIIFAAEKAVFPLRCVASLREYQRITEEYDRQSARIPRESDKRIQFPDILPDPPEVAVIWRRAASASLLGKIFGFFVRDVDQHTEYARVYLRYFDAKNRTNREFEVASDWATLKAGLANPQIERDIKRRPVPFSPLDLVEDLISTRAREAETKSQRERLWLELQGYLDDLAASLPGHSRNPAYKEDLDVIAAFRERFQLTPPDEPQDVEQDEKSGESGDARSEFRTVVVKMLRAGRGRLGVTQQSYVEKRRQALGIPEAEARAIVGTLTGGGQSAPRHEYAEFVVAMYNGENDLSSLRRDFDEERARLGLSPDEAADVEKAVVDYYDLYRAMAEVATEDWARNDLEAKRAELRLPDDIVAAIEEQVRGQVA